VDEFKYATVFDYSVMDNPTMNGTASVASFIYSLKRTKATMFFSTFIVILM
jgi:hypothetical protein